MQKAKAGYIVMRGGKLWRLGADGTLELAENKLAPSLFESYDVARKVVRRTESQFKKVPHPNAKTQAKALSMKFEIIGVERVQTQTS